MRMGSRRAGWWGIAFVVVLLAAGAMASVPTSKASTQHIQTFYVDHRSVVSSPRCSASWPFPVCLLRRGACSATRCAGPSRTAGLRRRRPAHHPPAGEAAMSQAHSGCGHASPDQGPQGQPERDRGQSRASGAAGADGGHRLRGREAVGEGNGGPGSTRAGGQRGVQDVAGAASGSASATGARRRPPGRLRAAGRKPA
jgi:hypothetical protein